jgi:anti-anti-sigma factor
MNLRIVSIERDGSVRLEVDGPITSDSFAAASDNPLEGLLGGEWWRHHLLLDMSRADYLDSAGVGWLINCHRALTVHGGTMALHSVPAKALRILQTLKIDSILPLAQNEAAARKVLKKEAA